MHEFTPEVENLADEILAYSLERLKSDPPLDGPRTEADLFREVGNTITGRGLGGQLYWYSIAPLHTLVFPTMIRNIVKRAEADA